MLTALDHVIVAVRDLEAATARTVRLLSRTPSWRGEHPAEGTANTLFRVANTYLELIAPLGDGPGGRSVEAFLESRGEGLLGLAFQTADAEACHAAFAEAGLDPDPPTNGLGRDVESGAFREWRRVNLPLERTRGVFLFAIEHRSPPDALPPAGWLGSEESGVEALDHVVVNTADGDAARAFYGEKLGLRLALDRSFPKWKARMLFFRVGGVTVEVVARLGDELPQDDGDRLFGLCWQVSDADATRARLIDTGFDVSDVRAGRKPGTRVLTVRDGTCGVPTLLLEPGVPA